MQGFTFVLLVASVALLGTVIPVQTTFVGKRETNGERFVRDLSPLPPPRRSPTDTGRRRQVSPLPGPNTYPSGRLRVSYVDSPGIIGYVSDNPSGPGLNIPQDDVPPLADLFVWFTGTSLKAENPSFDPPYIGGDGTNVLTAQNLNTIQFTNVNASYAQGWTLDPSSGQLNYTWTNTDGSVVNATLLADINTYNTNRLSFTADPTGVQKADSNQFPCTIFLDNDVSDS